jgi:hypothetical protein
LHEFLISLKLAPLPALCVFHDFIILSF